MTATTAEAESTCSRCGKPTPPREIPSDLSERWAEQLRRIPLVCDHCDHKRMAEIDHDDAIDAEQKRVERHQVRVSDAGMPLVLAEVDWADVEVDDVNREAVEQARRWGLGEITGLVLSGNVGVGKTWIAAAGANTLLQRKSLRWFSASKLMAQARAGFKNPSRDEVTELLINEHMALVLDDIDKISPTEYALDIFFQIIDSRINNRTPMLVTTNKTYDELEAQFGEAIASRMAKMVGVRIKGDDRRVTFRKRSDA